MVILKLKLEEGMDWIQVAHNRVQWQSYKHGNQFACSIKGRKFHNLLNDFQLLKMAANPWN
jgi:hypothetical protein